ncbi:helix-hairpin-helix domain-containing protein [Clostridium ganghwense]|uniref:Helix-hairpin-helix domain-containing protein n=1 Tax=Clostridium ganghwense TaxID=312089 RepID=A0ABT4CS30_9CLOT|nr:helix-hairpin-helix domain-containing protein [Clostridium ganghwense]MCY6371847.1 helix-hairpin-helix domain-containing protein [Clostridium ganghwense]
MDKKEKLIGSIVMVVGCLIFLVVGYFSSKPKAYNSDNVFKKQSIGNKSGEVIVNNSRDSDNNSSKADSNDYKTIIVEIKGQVRKPNVYEMKFGSRVYELIQKAGGYTPNADTYSVNGSMKLNDEDCIVIYSKDEMKNSKIPNTLNRVHSTAGSQEKGKININIATKEELKTLSGVGDVTAQKIIDYREQNGGFSSINELTKINRIGEKTVAKFKDKIEVR